MQTIDQIQQQINDVQAQAKAKIAELQKQADAARKAASGDAIKEVKRLVALHQLTAADIGLGGGAKSVKTKSSGGDNRAAVAPKYRDGQTGQTWSGRGKSPTWLAAKLAAGASKESFRI
jgi:DNA-binding protein H-NS